MTMVFLVICLFALDTVMLAQTISWINILDQLRLAMGLTCVVRILIVHAEVKTLVLCAGFFSYMYFNSLYTAFVKSEENMH